MEWIGPKSYRFTTDRSCRIAIKWKEFSAGKHCRQRLVGSYGKGATVWSEEADGNRTVYLEGLVL